jgi:transcriptional regulator with XRE-family HTH domain
MLPLQNIGERLRSARRSRQMSLDSVAKQLGVSVATLSRIETNKQGIDLPFFIQLADVIGVAPASFLDEDGKANGNDGLIRRLAAFPADERAQIMIAASRDGKPNGTRVDLHRRLDTLLATLDIMRDQLLEVRLAVRKRG